MSHANPFHLSTWSEATCHTPHSMKYCNPCYLLEMLFTEFLTMHPAVIVWQQ
jgi:hypothetical protein